MRTPNYKEKKIQQTINRFLESHTAQARIDKWKNRFKDSLLTQEEQDEILAKAVRNAFREFGILDGEREPYD